MLTLNKPLMQNAASTEDSRILAMAEGIGLMTKALEGMIPKRSENPLNFMPRLYKAEGHDLNDNTILFDFTYIRNNRLYAFTLPAFISLEERSPNSAIKENIYFSKDDKVNASSTDKFIKILYHPLFMAAAGFGATANIFNMAFTLAKVKIASLAVVKASGLLFNIAGLAASLLYFVPVLLYYYNNVRLRDELLDIFDDAMTDINNDHCDIAWSKLENLKIQHSVLLHPNYPDNDDLRWSYYYMEDLINEKCNSFRDCDSYKMALRLSHSSDQKFLVLKGLLNVYDWRHENQVKKFNELKGRFVTEKERNSLNKNKMHIDAIIAPYIEQIDPASPMHKQLQEDLHYKLQQCVDNIRDGNNALAKNIFDQIKFGGYCKKSYPAAAILYYQLHSVLTLCMESYEPFDMLSLCPIGRLRIARKNLSIIQEYIDKYYPEMSQQHQEYIDLYDKFDLESDAAYDEPNPTNVPIIFSEAAPKITPLEKQEDIAADIGSLYPSRAPSPTNYLS